MAEGGGMWRGAAGRSEEEGRRKSHLGTKESKGQLCITERNQGWASWLFEAFLTFPAAERSWAFGFL